MTPAFVLTSLALAQTKPVELTSASDHPVISRYLGSVLYNASTESYASLRIPKSAATFGPDSKLVFKESVTHEGAVNAYFYLAPQEKTALEVFRNYQLALKKAGFELLFECELTSCDKALIRENFAAEAVRNRPWSRERMAPGNSFNRDVRFVSARLARDGKELYALLFVAEPTSVWEMPAVALVVAAPAPLETDKVLVSTDALKKGLADDGKVLLYGLFFDTGKAELKSESKPQLDEMAKALKDGKSLSVLIVGHTDNVGSIDANLSLSLKRAQSVAAALINTYGIAEKQLMPRGVANFAPVASNASEAGRARNRRVEMVTR